MPPTEPFLIGRAKAYEAMGRGLLDWADVLEQRQGTAIQEEQLKAEEERKQREDKEPLPPRKWIENPYFSGDLAESLYPKLKDLFARIFEEQYHEIVMGGATRYGKTTLALAVNGYSLYLLSCMGSPQRNFHKMAESIFLMLNTNVTDLKARSAYFAKFTAWVKSTAYFAQDFRPKPNVITQLQFPKNLHCRFSGASANAPESEDLVFFLGDEANLYDVVDNSKRAKEGTKFDAAEEIDHAVSWRMNGTFMRADGTFPDPCKIVWLCKETYPNSFIRRKVRALKQQDLLRPGKALVIESTEWGTKPEGTYGTKVFHLRTASRMESERVLKPEEVEQVKREAARLEADPNVPEDERFKVFEVPEVHRRVAEENLARFIRDGCGWPTESISLFLRDREWIRRAIRRPGDRLRSGLVVPATVCQHPFRSLETTLLPDSGFLPVICHQTLVDGELRWRPVVNPSAPRFIHLDAGLTTDPMGITMLHQAGWVEVERYSEEVKGYCPEIAPLIFVDFMLRVLPEPGRKISFGAARNLVRDLRNTYGFIIQRVTMDSFQHVALDQPLTEDGFEAEVVSVDKTMDAYDFVEKAFAEDRISVYENPVFIAELSQLERVVTNKVRDGRVVVKVDHRPGERKDVCDSLAGSLWQLELAATKRAPAQPAAVERAKVEARKEQAKLDVVVQSAFERGDFEQMQEMGVGQGWA